MKTLGRHLIAEYYGCAFDKINDVEYVQRYMREAASKIGATVLSDKFHQFEPQGVSGTVVIAESHLSIHTWPERGYVAVDIFTCGGLDPSVGFESLGVALEAKTGRVQEILRGLPEDMGDGDVGPEDIQIITKMTDEIKLRSDDEEAA